MLDSGVDTVVGEDVLHGEVPPPPAKRTSFHRRRDLVVAVTLLVALLTAGTVIWRGSDITATSRQPAADSPQAPEPPSVFPPSLAETWRADSPATGQPAVVGPTVVTGAGGEVAGRDPVTGEIRWRYIRNLPLCAVAPIDTVPPQRADPAALAVAVFATDGNWLPSDDPRASGGCSEVTAMTGGTGTVTDHRNADAESGTTLISDGSYVTATGRRYLTTWHSDLTAASVFGPKPATVTRRKELRTDCEFDTPTMASGRIGVIEHCATGEPDRLTVYQAQAPHGKDNDEVVVLFSVPVSAAGRIVAMTGTHVAVAERSPDRIVVYGNDGTPAAEHPLPGHPSGPVLTTRLPEAVVLFTGTHTVALSTVDLRPMWTVEGTLGPGVLFAGRLVVPVPAGLAVVVPATGERTALIPVDRAGHRGQVTMSTIGPIVLEQRGSTLVALR